MGRYRRRLRAPEQGCLREPRTDAGGGWTALESAARWGRWATYVAVLVPLPYAAIRWAWALGFPLGISEEFLREGQEIGLGSAGAALSTVDLAGVVLTLGLIQRWGEVFPRWMVGVSGKRVPATMAIVPASLVSVMAGSSQLPCRGLPRGWVGNHRPGTAVAGVGRRAWRGHSRLLLSQAR